MPRLAPLRPAAMSEAQREVYNSLLSGKRGAGLTAPDGSLIGPFNAAAQSAPGQSRAKPGGSPGFETLCPVG